MMPASNLVIIVNYRTADHVIVALRAVAPEIAARGDTRLIVVDNGSGDESAERIAEAIVRDGAQDWCIPLALADNRGFAAGNNAAIRHFRDLMPSGTLPDHVWLLNPDTIAQPDALSALLRFMADHPDAGIVGGRCLWPDGRAHHSAFRFHSPMGEFIGALSFGPLTRRLRRHEVPIEPNNMPIRVDWVSGSHLMIRRAVIEAIGLMDESYFLYFEETAYCARAADAGFACYHVPDSRIIHIGGQSTGVTGLAVSRRRPRYWFESRVRFFTGRYGRTQTHIANLLWIVAYPPGRLLAALRGRAHREPPRLWRDFIRHNYGPGGLMYRTRP